MPPLNREGSEIQHRTTSNTNTQNLDSSTKTDSFHESNGFSQQESHRNSVHIDIPGQSSQVIDSVDTQHGQSTTMSRDATSTVKKSGDEPHLAPISATESTPLLESGNTNQSLEEIVSKIPTTPFRPDTPFTGWTMAGFWFSRLIIPSAVLVWYLTHSIILVILAAFFFPCFSIYQGATGMLHYRATFGDCPAPKAPSHGVVKVKTKAFRAKASTATKPSASTKEGVGNVNDNTPLRLLIIGDSLAMGVGQSKTATPVMPETIAKTLSWGMGGRPVLWTCHGSSGASAGWIVQELDRSIQRGRFAGPSDLDDIEASHSSISFDISNFIDEDGKASIVASDSGSDDSSLDDQNADEETQTWQERLRQERIHFDPNTVGPFDIAVVLTGSNDLKSAFFPYLLTGDDVEFRREAQERGGGYSMELTRVIETLKQRMRQRLENLRESVDKATQRMRERLGSVESLPSLRAEKQQRWTRSNSTSQVVSEKYKEGAVDEEDDGPIKPHFPMVVLPGNPARALPVFTKKPLHWLAVPMVDIMDSNKREIAAEFPDEVMFVPAPTNSQIAEYLRGEGEFRKQEMKEDVVLNLRDIKKRQARKLEAEMDTYFHLGLHGPENKTYSTAPRNLHFEIFSVDGTHPNDQGYEFWGRHMGHHILQEWKRREKSRDT